MNVALFGGTFDPVHNGHLAVAKAAQQRFDLGRIYFVPASVPPHKNDKTLTPYHHRFAMLALATQGEKVFVPSLLESPDDEHPTAPSYSLDTVRRLKAQLGRSDRLFFLIGIDAFKDIATWHEPEQLLAECEFVVVSRPGFSLADVAESLPESIRPPEAVTRVFRKQQATGDLVLPHTTIHLLSGVNERVSATQVRAAATNSGSLSRLVPDAVAEYIKKEQLYRSPRARSAHNPARLRLVHGAKRKGHAEER
jgi:nicotinate-nucleotide adenylyltransferase